MDQFVQCPVCTLYLHNGMTLESHLETHPKDQVIKALCSLTTKGSGCSYGSRTSTPLHSERSYRSRSRTPATDDRWPSSQRSSDNERYWRRTPSRTSKSSQILPNSRNATPDIRLGEMHFDNNINDGSQFTGTPYAIKSDKTQQTFSNVQAGSEFEQPYTYYQDSNDDREIKYSRSAEYNPLDSNSSIFTHKSRSLTPGTKMQTTLLPPVTGKSHENLVKLLPKPNNILVKTNNIGGVQYLTQGVKPLHVMVPTAPTFVQKNLQNSMLMAGGIPVTTMVETKTIGALPTNQFNQFTSSTFTPGTTVVQNSQFIYREMVHSIDGKRFISCVPSVLSHENVTNVAQGTSMYQNLMVVDQLRNAPCMYGTSQPIIAKPCVASLYTNNMSHLPSTTIHTDKNIPTSNDANKTLIIEVGPIVPPPQCEANTSTHDNTTQTDVDITKPNKIEVLSLEKIEKSETPGSTKGLKILSNIKVEVPVQHHKNMLNTVMDLTGPNESDYPVRAISPEKILPDLDENMQMSDDCTQPSISSSDSIVSHTFSVIKNVGKPPSYKDSSSKSSLDANKIDSESADSCPVPDLICNEKPSISPCSELSESGENSSDPTSISTSVSPRLPSQAMSIESKVDKKTLAQQRPYRQNTLRLNNIYVKKHKKVLQIKNAKTFPVSATLSNLDLEPRPSSSTCRSPETYSVSKMNKERCEKLPKLHPLPVERITATEVNDNHEFDADTEEQSMDIEPSTPGLSSNDQFTTSIDVVQVKEEVNTSNEDGYSNENSSNRDLGSMETLRPINVITYGNMPSGDFDDESDHRELLELDAASKNNKFVSMMNENYFGDNIYADYFTPDRVEGFEERVSFAKDTAKDIYMWGAGESSHKDSEFVLPNFIHESYKIAESNVEYSDMRRGVEVETELEEEGCERDSKADVLSESRSEGEPPLNICADERMPPRGELSGQESNGDMESPWTGMYADAPPAESYDLIARESWVSDGSEIDATDKRDNLEVELQFPKVRSHTCTACGAKFPTLRELRTHRSQVHAPRAYTKLITKAIKKEEKIDDGTVLPVTTMLTDSKESISTTMLQVYDVMTESKPKLETLIKQEPKQRRKRDFVCPTCKVDQLTEVSFHAHLKIHPLECLTCGKCFYRRANLALHIKTHLGIKNYKCEVCEKRFVTKQKLEEHHNVHTGRAPVKCTLCDTTFRRYSNMLAHRDRHHFQKKAKVRDYVCQCGAVFHSRAKLHWHKETHDGKPKACLYCSDKFVHAASLTRHVRRTHRVFATAAPKDVPCPVCNQMYLRSNLRAHLMTHSGKRPYVCIICNKSFTTKWNLKLHRWTHMSRSAKPFKCHLCKGAFIRHAEFVSHMNAHKSVRPYTCNYCGCQFIRKYNCQRHVREHQMAKKYVCKVPECGKSFHRSYYLSEHMKVHSGARPFACNICGKTSSNKSNHNKHLKIHHAREPVATEA